MAENQIKKILVAPDKFKYSLTAIEVCNAVEEGVRKKIPSAEITKIPLADGGEGSLTTLQNTIKFKKIYLNVNDPLSRQIRSFYGLLNDTAYIEMATASGLQLLKQGERDVMKTSSYGTGELIRDALKKGVKKIYLFIGGSATNDAGMGIASALGYEFLDEKNNILEPIGENLIKVKSINRSKAASINDVDVFVLTDVNNPMFGMNGAAHVFAAQKGAGEKDINQLDEGLKNISEIIKGTFGKDVSALPGSGAAGGIGGGVVAFCNAEIKSGIDTILDLLEIENHIARNDLVITGEGLLDSQTLEGKVVMGVMNLCKKINKPLGILCGDMTLSGNDINMIYPSFIKKIKKDNISKEDAMENAYKYLVQRSEELIKEITD